MIKKITAVLTALTICAGCTVLPNFSTFSAYESVVSAAAKNDSFTPSDWVPYDYDSAISWLNTHGPACVKDNLVVLVYKSASDPNTKNVVTEAEPVYHKVLERSSDSEFSMAAGKTGTYEVMIFSPKEDLSVTLNRINYTFSADKNGNVTQTDWYSWVPDCFTEFGQFKTGAPLFIKNGYVVFCNTSTGGTGYSWINTLGDEDVKLEISSCCSTVYDDFYGRSGGAVNYVDVYKPLHDGIIELEWVYACSWDIDGTKFKKNRIVIEVSDNCSVVKDITASYDTKPDISFDMKIFSLIDTGRNYILDDDKLHAVLKESPSAFITSDEELKEFYSNAGLNPDKCGYDEEFFEKNDLLVNLDIDSSGGDAFKGEYAKYNKKTLEVYYSEEVNYRNILCDTEYLVVLEAAVAKNSINADNIIWKCIPTQGEAPVYLKDYDTGKILYFGEDTVGLLAKIGYKTGKFDITGDEEWIWSTPLYYLGNAFEAPVKTELADYMDATKMELSIEEGTIPEGWYLPEDGIKTEKYDNNSMCITVSLKKLVKHDANGDGKFNVLDLIAMQRWMLGYEDAAADTLALDMNDDDKITIIDFVMMKNALLEF